MKLTNKLIISDALHKVLEDSKSVIAEKILKCKSTTDFKIWINYLDIAQDDPTKISYIDKNRFLTYHNKYLKRSRLKKIKSISDIKIHDEFVFIYDQDDDYGLPISMNGAIVKVIEVFTDRVQARFEGTDITMFFKINHLHPIKDVRKLWDPKVRYMSSCGKTITKMFGQQNGKELADFCNLFNAYHPNNRFNIDYEIKFVNGDDIRYWYDEDQYDRCTGELGSSCMRYSKCYDWLELYSRNKDLIEMCVVINKDTNKLIARSLIWDKMYFDRIYAIDSKIEQETRKYLLNLGKLDAYNDDLIITLDIPYGSNSFDFFPYCDTFKYLSNAKISTDSDINYDFVLDNAAGNNDNYITCEISGELAHEDEVCYIEDYGYVLSEYACYSKYYGRYILSDDAVYSEWMEDYILSEESVRTYDNDYTHQDRAVELHNGLYIDNSDDYEELECGNYALSKDCVYSELNNGYILEDDAHHCDVQNDWVYEYQLKEENEEEFIES